MGKVMVTGASGNVGRYVVKELLGLGESVVAAAPSVQTLQELFHGETEITAFDFTDKSTYDAALNGVDRVFLMRPPHLGKPEDLYTHINKENQIDAMIKAGITAACDVCVPKNLKAASEKLYIHTSYSMALGDVFDGEAYVENAVKYGAEYIKVILEEPARMAFKTMDKEVLCDIVSTAHKKDLKVAAHAVTIPMVRMSADAGVDILIHVPMESMIPQELAEQIVGHGISVIPTLVMMEAFAKSLFFGYKKAHYANAENNVRPLHSLKVPILVGTDANNSLFVPKIEHGKSLYREMDLLVKTGLLLLNVLQGATSKIADAFGIRNMGSISPGKNANLILVEGKPDKIITNSNSIKQIWIGGKPIL